MLSGGQNCFRLGRLEPLVVDAVAAVGVHVSLEDLHVVHGVREHHDAARREHDVVVQDLRQVAPHAQRMVVELRARVEQVVRTDDRRVATGVAAADPALLDDRDAREPVLGGEVVRGRESVTSAADDDRVVLGLRRRAPPLGLPALLTAECFTQQRPGRELPHQAFRCRLSGSNGESTSTVARLRSPSTSMTSPVPTAANLGST